MPPSNVIIPKISVKIDIILLSLLKEKILIKFSYSLCVPVIENSLIHDFIEVRNVLFQAEG